MLYRESVRDKKGDKEMEQSRMKELIHTFNRGELRRKLIPAELASGWPCIRKAGGKLCVVIPYFNRRPVENGYALYPIYCSVTILWNVPGKMLDFTIYPLQEDWKDVDYSKPSGFFKHKALEDVRTRDEYIALCDRLYGYYDEMVLAVSENRPFDGEREMAGLFSKLMEPSLYPFYEKINKKFYSNFYKT